MRHRFDCDGSPSARLAPRRAALAASLCALALLGSCDKHPRKIKTGATSGETQVVGKSWDLCIWLGPSKHRKGIFGTDLGFDAPLPAANDKSSVEQLLLFGDTYSRAAQDCQYPRLKQDDLAARIPLMRPGSLSPGAPQGASDACDTLRYSFEDPSEPTGWRPIRIFPDATDDNPERALDTGLNRTAATAWGDGTHTFAIYYAGGAPRCHSNADCPEATTCSQDDSYHFPHIGGCEPNISLSSNALPRLCRSDSDCSSVAVCSDLDKGVCIADAPFRVSRDGQDLTPDWYEHDPRDGMARQMLVVSAFWPDRPENFAIGARYNTTKFINVTGRTVKHFDPDHPENNDYTPGYETLLLWGRQSFVGHDGYQTLPFLLYQPLGDFIDEQGHIDWAPRFFAGYDSEGKPSWSDQEADAQPVYGVDENLMRGPDGRWKWDFRFPEFDYVNQMSVSYAEPLKRWIMFYGGEVPHEIDPGKDALPARTYPQSVPGAIYLRSALHPWGRATAGDPRSDGYGEPRPVLPTKLVKKHLACGKAEPSLGACNPDLPQKPAGLLNSVGAAITDFSFGDILEASAKCAAGGEAIDSQYSGFDQSGHLYGASIIHSWTQEVTDEIPDLAAGDRAVELYWNVSTWNPYQALLIKTQLRASEWDRDGHH